MLLNHLNLTVTDVNEAVAFFETYCGLRKTGGNSGMGFMVDDAGLVLSLMKSKSGQVQYPGFFHVGFFIGDKAKVDSLHRSIREAGYSASDPVQAHAYTFYVEGPGGLRVEIGA